MDMLKIPFYRPVITLSDFAEALKEDNKLDFKEDLEKALNTKFKEVFALNSGTSAFYLFLRLFTDKGDEIILPSILCPIMLSPILKLQRTPVIVDVNPETFNIDVQDLEKKISKKTKVIVPAHIYGQPCEIEKIMEIAEEKDILVLEDCAHALGAEFKGKKVGTFGHGSFFSFNWTKVITTGGGGVLALNRLNTYIKPKFRDTSRIAKTLRLFIASILLKNERTWRYAYTLLRFIQSKIPKKIQITSQNSDPLSYSEYVASQGIVPKFLDLLSLKVAHVGLKKLRWYNKRRAEIAKIYNDILGGINSIQLPVTLSGREHIFYAYTILIEEREKVREELLRKGIETSIIWPIPLHEIVGGRCPVSSTLIRRMLSLPLYPSLSDENVKNIAEQVTKAVRGV